MVRKRCQTAAFAVVLFACFSIVNAHGYNGELVCRKCGKTIVDSADFVRIASVHALAYRNETLHGGRKTVFVQRFRNPHGVSFNVVTAKQANIETVGQSYGGAESWFPGYAWTVAVCPKCSAHLGWSFERNYVDPKTGQPRIDSFAGLILDNVLCDDFSDTLTMVPRPRTYRDI